MLPLFAPSLVQALAFIYVFGNNGIFTRATGYNVGIYGAKGIVVAEVFYCFPHALLILVAALSATDARLYDAARTLGASPLKTFLTVTLPGVKFGLVSACFVVFTLVITDFGAPKAIGGKFSVMATEIYNQVSGQQNFTMGATVSVVLLIPAVLAFLVDRMVQRRQYALVTSSSRPLAPRPPARSPTGPASATARSSRAPSRACTWPSRSTRWWRAGRTTSRRPCATTASTRWAATRRSGTASTWPR